MHLFLIFTFSMNNFTLYKRWTLKIKKIFISHSVNIFVCALDESCQLQMYLVSPFKSSEIGRTVFHSIQRKYSLYEGNYWQSRTFCGRFSTAFVSSDISCQLQLVRKCVNLSCIQYFQSSDFSFDRKKYLWQIQVSPAVWPSEISCQLQMTRKFHGYFFFIGTVSRKSWWGKSKGR
jgi:hypothetical protein